MLSESRVVTDSRRAQIYRGFSMVTSYFYNCLNLDQLELGIFMFSDSIFFVSSLTLQIVTAYHEFLLILSSRSLLASKEK